MKVFLSLIRVLFPRWNFFDRIGSVYCLEVKPQGSNSWHRISLESKNPLWSLFFNPEGNFILAQQSLLEHFIQDLEELGQKNLKELATYKMIKSLVEERGYLDGEFRVVEE